LELLLEEGMNEIQLLNKITAFMQNLFMINTYLKLNGNLNIKEIWGFPLPKQIAEQQASIATRFKKEDYIYMLNFLLDLELELKSSKIADINSYFQAKIRIFMKSNL
jgi:DNA polymerase-3 subunit delta